MTFPKIYRDSFDLFLEFDGMVLRFPFTEGGLAKALAHIPNVASHPGYLTGRQNVADRLLRPKPKTKVGRRGVAIGDEQAKTLDSILAELKK